MSGAKFQLLIGIFMSHSCERPGIYRQLLQKGATTFERSEWIVDGIQQSICSKGVQRGHEGW